MSEILKKTFYSTFCHNSYLMIYFSSLLEVLDIHLLSLSSRAIGEKINIHAVWREVLRFNPIPSHRDVLLLTKLAIERGLTTLLVTCIEQIRYLLLNLRENASSSKFCSDLFWLHAKTKSKELECTLYNLKYPLFIWWQVHSFTEPVWPLP